MHILGLIGLVVLVIVMFAEGEFDTSYGSSNDNEDV